MKRLLCEMQVILVSCFAEYSPYFVIERWYFMSGITETFPDGTPIGEWFYDVRVPELETLGRQYVLTQYYILDDGKVHTGRNI